MRRYRTNACKTCAVKDQCTAAKTHPDVGLMIV
jgi:hypothetical protein